MTKKVSKSTRPFLFLFRNPKPQTLNPKHTHQQKQKKTEEAKKRAPIDVFDVFADCDDDSENALDRSFIVVMD